VSASKSLRKGVGRTRRLRDADFNDTPTSRAKRDTAASRPNLRACTGNSQKTGRSDSGRNSWNRVCPVPTHRWSEVEGGRNGQSRGDSMGSGDHRGNTCVTTGHMGHSGPVADKTEGPFSTKAVAMSSSLRHVISSYSARIYVTNLMPSAESRDQIYRQVLRESDSCLDHFLLHCRHEVA